MNETTYSSLLHSVLSCLGYIYLKFTGITTRIKTEFKPDKTNYIYALWHANLAFLLYCHRGSGISVLVSKSRDGEYIARILRKFGFNTIRGSSSAGASQSLMSLIDQANLGLPVGITPDGPRGPKGKVQPGAIYIAQKTGMEILPVAVGLSNKLVLNSWDKFQLPLPFGKAALAYGAPIKVSETDSIAEKSAELETCLASLEERAMQLLNS